MASVIDKHPFDNVMVLDALSVAFRWKHKKQFSFAQDFLTTAVSLANSYKCGQVIIAADMKGSSYRREIFPDYKGNRKAQYENQTPAEKKDAEAFFRGYEDALELLSSNFLVLRYPGVEADDIAAYVVKRRKEYGIKNIWLISADADWDLLVDEDVSRFSTVTRKEITVDTWPYDVPREEYISFKVLTGDTGDNIPGIPGIGPKRAADLIKEYGSAFDIYASCPIDSKYKHIQAINSNKEQILKNYELMDLITYCEEAIGSQNVLDIGRALMLNERKR